MQTDTLLSKFGLLRMGRIVLGNGVVQATRQPGKTIMTITERPPSRRKEGLGLRAIASEHECCCNPSRSWTEFMLPEKEWRVGCR